MSDETVYPGFQRRLGQACRRRQRRGPACLQGHAPYRVGGGRHRFGVRDAFDQQDFAVLILDAETKKEGGMSVAQDLLETREDVPPIIFLTARPQDEWLATWAGATATVSDPIDPIILQETVAEVLRGAAR